MVSKVLFSLFASVLFVQAVYGQCGNNYLSQSLTSCGCGLGSGLSGLNFGSNAYGCGSAASTSGYGVQSGPLSVASGSYTTPNGISVFAENLEILGQVGVSGSLPFVGAVVVEGALPSGGQGSVIYSSAPGVGLTSAGCGQGLSGLSGNVLSGAVLNNGLAGYGSNNMYGANVLNAGYSSVGGCGCY